MLNDQKDKLRNNPEVSNRTNQFQTVVMIEPGNPLLEPIEGSNPLWIDHGPNERFQGMIDVLNHIDCVPSNVQFSYQEAMLYVFEDSEALILSFREGVPQWDMFPGPTELRLIWWFDRINLDPKIQIKCIDTKIQLAHILT